MQPTRTFCSRRARSSGTSPAGTATEASSWLLIEVPGPWGSQALPESDLPDEVKDHLDAWVAAGERRRVQFIRRSIHTFDRPGRVRVFLADVRPPAGLYQTALEQHTDLLDIDLDDPKAGPTDPWTRRESPVFLTCTNGRRDACCARWGRAMADAMSDAAVEDAWQTTHLGGHRFAPTQLVLPHGAQYAWLEPGDAPLLVRAHRNGTLYRLHAYRGHVGFDRPVQAAEVFLRQQLKIRALEAVRLDRVEENDAGRIVVLRADDNRYELEVAAEDEGPILPSCGDELKPSKRWVVKQHSLVEADG